ncbi:CSLREA domain-containing protein [Dokdonella soli]
MRARIASVVLFLAGASLAQATTFTVTSAADTDGTSCGATCTLRQAINASNAAGGANTINFNIPGTGPFTIAVASQLPSINTRGTLTSLIIGGYSQPAA